MAILPHMVMRTAGRAAAKRFESATRNPAQAQHRKLMQIVRANQDTEYGRKHHFADVRGLQDWQRLVPTVTYKDIGDDVDRMCQGTGNILTAENPIMFARTSGTTGKPKYIPVTPTCRGRDHADQMRTWLYHAWLDHPDMFRGKVLSLVSPAVEGRFEDSSNLPYGSTSGLIYKNLPWMVRSTYAIPYQVFEIEDYFSKYYVLLRLGIASDVSFLCTANPSSIVKLCEIANTHAEDLLRDIHDGTLRAPELKVEPSILSLVTPLCRADPQKAGSLRDRVAKRGGKLLPADYWPNLSLIGCWKGGTVGSYLAQFPNWFNPTGDRPVPVRDWGYLSSEARGSIPLSDHTSAGVLTVATNLYEFVRVDNLESNAENPAAWEFLGVDQVEDGNDYYIFVTTTGGLYRYDINDVIRVCGFYHNTPMIKFLRKGRGMTSLTGEKVSVDQVEVAFSRATREVGVTVDHFKAEADPEQSRYVFKTEIRESLSEDQAQALLRALDTQLADLNIEYKGKRESLRLRSPVLVLMEPGWYARQKDADLEAGGRDFQGKTLKLSLASPEAESLVTRQIRIEDEEIPWKK